MIDDRPHAPRISSLPPHRFFFLSIPIHDVFHVCLYTAYQNTSSTRTSPHPSIRIHQGHLHYFFVLLSSTYLFFFTFLFSPFHCRIAAQNRITSRIPPSRITSGHGAILPLRRTLAY